MTLRHFVAVTIFVAASNAAFAQKDDAENQAPKPTIEDAQKLVDTIRDDKTKLKAYCELGKLHEQIEKAEEKNDSKEMDTLVAKLDSFEQQVGPDCIRVMDGLGDVDPSSAEGQKFTAVLEPLHKQCK
jgi:hypothetical protein